MKPLLLPPQVLSQIQVFSFSHMLTTPARCNRHATPATVKVPLIQQPRSSLVFFRKYKAMFRAHERLVGPW